MIWACAAREVSSFIPTAMSIGRERSFAIHIGKAGNLSFSWGVEECMSDKHLRYKDQGSLLVDALMALLLIAFMIMIFIHAIGIWQSSQQQREGVDIDALYREGSGIYDD